MAELIEFDTERLRLRQWCAADREPFAALNADLKVMEFFPALLSRPESDAMANRCEALIAKRGWGFWAVETRNTQSLSALLVCIPRHLSYHFLPVSRWAGGWLQNTGVKATPQEAARGALRVGFEQLELPEVVSFTSVGNIRSRAVMERLGMRDTEETFEHPNVPVGSALRKHCLYRLSRGQWLANDA